MLMYNLTSYADRPGHRVYDDEPSSAFSTILFAIFGIVIFGFFGFMFLSDSVKNGFKDKDTNQWGCMSIIAVIVGIILLVAMCSH